MKRYIVIMKITRNKMPETIHIVPVGFEEDRAVHGFIKLGADRIYLLIDKKENSWGEEARKHADIIKERLHQLAFNGDRIKDVFFDPTDFESSKNTVRKILEKEKNASKVYLNISSSTKLCAVAFALVATEYSNALLYYVVPKKYNLMGTFSSGAERIEVFSPRIEIKFKEWEEKILEALDKHKISSLSELNKIIAPDDISKAMCAKLSYYVRKLQEKGYIVFEPGKKITLTDLGRSIVHPPKDDAELVLDNENK